MSSQWNGILTVQSSEGRSWSSSWLSWTDASSGFLLQRDRVGTRVKGAWNDLHRGRVLIG